MKEEEGMEDERKTEQRARSETFSIFFIPSALEMTIAQWWNIAMYINNIKYLKFEVKNKNVRFFFCLLCQNHTYSYVNPCLGYNFC